jgi:ribosome biogenesis GTPase
MVTTVDRGRYTCLTSDGTTVIAMRARELTRTAIVVGDQVALVGDASGRDGTLSRIVRIDERRTVLRRTADDDDPVERIIVANADRMMIVTAVADPEPRPRLIDRCLVAAYDAGIEPVLCITKTDLDDPESLLKTYRPLDVPVVLTSQRAGHIDAAAPLPWLQDHTTVLVGHSGVGKSTLVNALVPDAHRAIGGVNVVTGRGRHTSSSAIAFPLGSGGWVVDTPGIRTFGLAHIEPQRLIQAFADLTVETADCPRGCTHGTDEPECALDVAVAAARVDPERVDSFRRLLASRFDSPDK